MKERHDVDFIKFLNELIKLYESLNNTPWKFL